MSTSPPPKFDRSRVPPKGDELEISIFGPGKGECIVLHLGDNEWCVIDSCKARGETEAVALQYLKNLGTNAIGNLRLVIATHWHDDHIQGLAAILEQAPQAKFCCSMALKSDEFLKLVSAAAENIAGRSGVEEFDAILKTLQGRGQPNLPILAVENKILLELPSGGRSFPVTLFSLSPSNATLILAMKEIHALIPQVKDPQQAIIDQGPNHTSIVISVQAGVRHALLGADLEQTNDPGTGWAAAIQCRPNDPRAKIFKVPHHGSITGDNPDVWSQRLELDPIAVVTPFAIGNVFLPKESDLERLAQQTPNLYCTAKSGGGKPPGRDTGVDRELRARIPDRRTIEGPPGHVRIRWNVLDQNAEPEIELFRGAYRFQSN